MALMGQSQYLKEYRLQSRGHLKEWLNLVAVLQGVQAGAETRVHREVRIQVLLQLLPLSLSNATPSWGTLLSEMLFRIRSPSMLFRYRSHSFKSQSLN